MSSDLLRLGEWGADVRELVDAQLSKSTVDELDETEATEGLWDRVFMHKKNGRSTPSEDSDTSTVRTRASNIIRITYISGITNMLYESRPEMQTTRATLMNKPLPSLSSEPSSVKNAKMPDQGYIWRLKSRYYPTDPKESIELGFRKHEILGISDVSGM